MIYLFDKDEQLIKLIRKDVIKTAQQKFELKDGYVSDRLTVEMRMLSDDDLQKVEYMAIQSINDTHDFHYFWIAQKNNTDNITTLVGVQSGIEELQKTVVYDQRPQNQLAKPVIDRLLEGTNWRARFIGGNQTRSTNFYYISTFEALKKVCSVWGLEMQFFVEMNGNKVGARYIDFKERIGKAVGSRVVYGHNALQILQEVERTNIYTALIGRGKGEETENGGFGRKLTFEDVEWTTPVAKPKGQRYVEIPSMTALYGIKNADGTMRPKIGTVDFQDETDANNLLKLTYEQLVNVSRPQVTFKTSTAYISNAEIGDTIRVVRHDKHIDYETRIFEITFNRLNNESADIKLGDNIKGEAEKRRIQSAVNESLDSFVENELKPAFEKLPEFLATADGKNTNWYSEEDPTVQYPGKVLINDVWYKPDPEFEGEKIMLRWTGEVWEEILRTSDPDRIKRSIDQQFEDFNTSYDEAKALQDKQIADVLAKAGTAEDLAKEAKRIGESASADALSLTNQLSTARQILQDSIDQAKSDAFSEAGRLSGIVESNANARIDEMSDSIQLLAKKDDVDNLSGRVTAAESELKIQADAISQKVSHSELDPLNQQINQNQTSITHLSDRVTTEVSSLESKIPTEIGARNYFRGHKYNEEITLNSYQNVGSFTQFYNRLTYPLPEADGKTFTISFEAISPNGDTVIHVYNSNVGNQYFYFRADNIGTATSTWKKFKVTVNPVTQTAYTASTNSNRIEIYAPTKIGVKVRNIKVELGTVATDWSPAPEDLDAELTSLKTTVTTTSDGVRQLTTKVTATEGRVSSAETSINQLIGEVSTKVAQRDYDGLLGRVSSAETTIRTQAGKIEQRLTSTQVNQLIDTKDFATTSTVQNIVQNTADSFTQTISRVEGKIPTEIGGRNYILRDNIRKGYINNDGNLIVENTIFTTNRIDASKRKDWTVTTKSGWIRINQYDVDGNFIKRDLYGPYTNKTSKLIRISAEIFMFDVSFDGTEYGEPYKIEFGTIATDWSPAPEDLATVTAFNSVKDTVDTHTRTIGDMQGNISAIAMTASGLIGRVTNAESGLGTVQSQLAGSWAVKNLTSNGAVLNQINLLANGNNRIDGRLTHITGSTLIDNGVIKSAMIGNAQINTAHIGTIDARQANIINLNASNITSGQITGINMRGGVLSALNGNVRFDLNNANLLFYSDSPAIKRVLSGFPTQFVKFATGTVDGKGRAGVTVIGSNRNGTESSNDGGFVGIRAWNGSNIDTIDVVGDTVRLTSSAYDSADGWDVITLPNKLEIDAHNVNHRVTSRLKIGDVWLWKNATIYSSLKETINLIIDNLRILHNNKTTEKNYSYTLPGKV